MIIKAEDRIRATLRANNTHIRLLLAHPMHSGRQMNTDNILINAEFIQDIRCWRNENEVLVIKCGSGTSQNPYFSFELAGGEVGDTIAIRWVDNTGSKGNMETVVDS